MTMTPDFGTNACCRAAKPTPVRNRRWLLLAAAAVLVAAGTVYLLRPRNTPPSSVTPSEALALAQQYVAHAWTAGPKNAFHGTDPDGVRLDTLDAGYAPGGTREGWWHPDQTNVGIPYKWGGFDLPDEFDAGLRAGKFAGDAYSEEKRRLLDDAVSRHAVGIDCSGFVSRCWKLPRSYSTRELPQLCDPVEDLSQLQPGDIFNKHNAHVRLFAAWASDDRQRASVYEASAKVQRRDYALADMLAEGYTAWRYRGMQGK
ncbi:MAG: hypothetical protein KA004_01450 [Verrucomicrobiales bacterium]|nr:hypothetical protein [Verrucomicrobiales bacterium]